MAKEVTTVKALIKEIAETRTQSSANAKDEVRVAQAMLNDPSYKVDVYSKKGVIGQYCPYDESRAMCASIIKDTTKVSTKEAEELASCYQFSKNDAQTMINFGKEFINTYTQTGRKLPLGGRAKSNVALQLKQKEAKMSSFPSVTVDAAGNKVYSTSQGKMVPAHNTLKVSGGAPLWLRK